MEVTTDREIKQRVFRNLLEDVTVSLCKLLPINAVCLWTPSWVLSTQDRSKWMFGTTLIYS